MSVSKEFKAHLASGLTTLARCWRVARKDGLVLGFTDHDCALQFEDCAFQADSGMTGFALEQGTGLGVDNTETLGALRADAISEEDISAGLYDGADVQCWLVNWAAPEQRMVLFAGQIGEVTRSGGRFQAEVRGLSEPLNQPIGRAYQKRGNCSLGDKRCRVDVTRPEYRGAYSVVSHENSMVFELQGSGAFDDAWFTHGALLHKASGQNGVIKADVRVDDGRRIELWTPLPGRVTDGDEVTLIAGCDGQFSTCRFKFANHLNFQGFPDLPGDDWITTIPRSNGVNNGGSLR